MSKKSKLILRHPAAIRVLHWSNMISITLLILTGFYIHSPLQFTLFSSMDTPRMIHFIFMWVLMFGTVGRVWYAIYTKDYNNVMFRLSDIKDFWSLGKYYLFISDKHPDYGKYNPGQKAMYTGVLFMIIIQVITGFIMYMPTELGTWAYALGGPLVVRLIHYCVTWLFILCVLVHVYLDVAEGVPVLKSIFTGTIPEDFHADVKIPRPSKVQRPDQGKGTMSA